MTTARRGKPVARLVPRAAHAELARAAVEKPRVLRDSIASRGVVFTWDELKACRDEGR